MITGLATVATSGSYNDLSNKPSIPTTPKAYVTSTYSSGLSWYRKWSDGWIEQGGALPVPSSNSEQTITLTTPFTTTNYFAKPDHNYSSATGTQFSYEHFYSKTKTTMKVKCTNAATNPRWYACGY